MSFVKTNLLLLACGAAGLVFLVIGICGAASSAVTSDMQQRVGLVTQIGALKADPKNEAVISAARRWHELFQQEYQRTLEQAHRINRRRPLLPGIFPMPERPSAGFEFAAAYARAIEEFYRTLVAGGLPGPAEIQDARDYLEHVKEEIPTAMDVTVDPEHCACALHARRIRCYAGPESFHVSPLVETNTVPSPEQMWFAQVGLWIQQDVVNAIARLNGTAAGRVGDGRAHVEHMPVKRIELLRVLGYQTARGLLPFPGGDAGGARSESFTGQTCNDQFDVVRFVLVVVVDQREMLQLIDQISKQNFYQCIGAGYSMVNPDDAQHGYLYGTEPVVRVQLEFEGYMARAVYKPLMPAKIREALGADKGDDG
ncbi:MAG TPA: hypothetical protein VM487_14015 [Phycisphaerae bacterium]|nr:hypothetical protein [Phycisphaerae bacterium]